MYCCSGINLLIVCYALARLYASMPESLLLRRKYSPAAGLYTRNSQVLLPVTVSFFSYDTINKPCSEKCCLLHCIDTKCEVKQVDGGSRERHGKYQSENFDVSCCRAAVHAWISGKKNPQ